jgi:hypothetical protein
MKVSEARTAVSSWVLIGIPEIGGALLGVCDDIGAHRNRRLRRSTLIPRTDHSAVAKPAAWRT